MTLRLTFGVPPKDEVAIDSKGKVDAHHHKSSQVKNAGHASWRLHHRLERNNLQQLSGERISCELVTSTRACVHMAPLVVYTDHAVHAEEEGRHTKPLSQSKQVVRHVLQGSTNPFHSAEDMRLWTVHVDNLHSGRCHFHHSMEPDTVDLLWEASHYRFKG